MSIRLLGGFEVSCGSQRVGNSAWRLSKARTVLQVLALTPGYRMHREQVLELLWPDLDHKHAAGNLYQAIHAARRALAGSSSPQNDLGKVVQLRQNVVALSPPGQLFVDVEEFERLGRNALITSDATGLRAALSLYQGDLLPEHPYDEWINSRRQLLRERYWSLLIELGWIEEHAGNDLAALDVYRQAIAFDPAREDGYAGIMRIEARRGQTAAALEQFDALKSRLELELGDKPDHSIEQLRDDILTHRFDGSAPSASKPGRPSAEQLPANNLPQMLTSFVGREREISGVNKRLSRHRLVTITGPGGSGKSRLAIVVAETLLPELPDGAWFVDLSAVSHPDLIEPAIIQALRLSPSWDTDASVQLQRHVAGKRMLLVLDGCDHLLSRCVDVVRILLRSSPGVRVLVTSREPLHLDGELIWRIPQLTVPEGEQRHRLDELESIESVRLFVERARLVAPTFELTVETAPPIVQICRALEGLPLAVELAAARMRVLSAQQVAERLSQSLNAPPVSEPRSSDLLQPLHLTLDWSYALLDERDRIVMQRLAAFSGGWTLEAAEAIVSDNDIPAGDVVDVLTHLVDKSLVIAEPDSASTRYRMLDPIRQFARDRLVVSGQFDVIQQRHADYFTQLAEPADSALRGADQSSIISQLKAEYDNLWHAIAWLVANQKTQQVLYLASLLGRFLIYAGAIHEARPWFDYLLRLPASEEYQTEFTRVLFWAGRIAYLQGDYDVAEERLTRCLEIAHQCNDLKYAAGSLTQLGHIAFRHRDLSRARALHEEALQLRRQTGEVWYIAISLRSVGLLAFEEGDLSAAWASIEESVALLREAGDEYEIVESLIAMGVIALNRHEKGNARRLLENALYRSQQSRYWPGMIKSMTQLGFLTLLEGDPVSAWRQFIHGLSVLRDVGTQADLAAILEGLAGVAAIRSETSSALFYLGAATAARESNNEPPLVAQQDHLDWISSMVEQCASQFRRSPEWIEAHSMSPDDVIERTLLQSDPLE